MAEARVSGGGKELERLERIAQQGDEVYRGYKY